MTNRYDVLLTAAAQRALRRVDRAVQDRLLDVVETLRDDPRPDGVKTLKGHHGLLRVRVGDYRIVYRVTDGELVVVVVTLRHRREVYRKL